MFSSGKRITVGCTMQIKFSFLSLFVFSQLAFTAAEIQRPGENIALGRPYKLDPRPTYTHCTDPDDKIQLTDGNYSKGYFWTQKSTVGWQNTGWATITIDLGAVQPIRGASFNTAAGTAGVEWPLGVTILCSDDGANFFCAGELAGLDAKRGGPPREKYAVYRYWTDELRTHGRYVLFIIAPGSPFIFADEVEIYKGDQEYLKIPFAGDSVTNAAAYRAHLAVERRLRDDLRSVRKADTQHKLTTELTAIEQDIPKLSRQYGKDFRTVLPLNYLHERIFCAQAELWRAQGAEPLTVWSANPWDPLSLTQPPPRDASAAVNVAMMLNEYRSAALNIANADKQTVTLSLKFSNVPPGLPASCIRMHEAVWTDTKNGKPVVAALPEAKYEAGKYLVKASAGLTRQIWLTFHPVDIAPGIYKFDILLSGNTLHKNIPVVLRVVSLRFPDAPRLHVGGWDYTDGESHYEITPQNREAVIKHLREHFVDSPWASSAVLPSNRDTVRFDRWLSRWPKARQYCVFAAVGESFDGTSNGMPEFGRKVGEWITFWSGHAQKRGLKPEQLVILLVDEPHDARLDSVIIPWAKAIRAANTGVKIWEDPTHQDPSKANQNMMALCHVLCPNRPMMLTGGPAFREYYAQRRAAGTELAFYSCSGPVRSLDPYAYHRLQAWTCWQQGAGSSFFWAFGDSGGGSSWNEYEMRGGSSYTPLFLDGTSITSAKHMEAIRESVEDYEYLVMLHDKIAAVKEPGKDDPLIERATRLLTEAADRVLNADGADKLKWDEPKDRSIADAIRLEILDILVQLSDCK